MQIISSKRVNRPNNINNSYWYAYSGKVIVADIDEVQGSKFCKELNE